MTKKTHVTLHHAAIYADNDEEYQFEKVDEIHKNRWDEATLSTLGYYGGYHYLIERDGTIKQYRNDSEIGAHNKDGVKRIGFFKYSANYYAIGICFAGNMSRQQLTDKQIRSVVDLVIRLQKEYDIPDENVLPHRDYKPTQCPGNNIPDKVWLYLLGEYELLLKKQPSIIKWHIKNKIIENWEGPIPDWKITMAWAIYKALKASSNKKLNFKL